MPEEGQLRLKTANYEVVFAAQTAWTIHDIYFRGESLSGPTGFYGTVLIPKGGKWIGTGHTEGGKEIVNSLKLTGDGQEKPIEAGATVEGHRIELVKTSTIHKFAATISICVTDEEIVERAQLRATEDHELARMYLFMHCWPKETTKWIAELADGKLSEGEFTSDGGNRVNADAKWVAEYWPERKWGILCWMPKLITGPQSKSFIWDKDNYHKYYVQQNGGAAFNQGDELDYTIIVKVIPDETGDWAATKAAVAELGRRH